MELDLEWDPPLKTRSGAAQRLCGIRVFYDFAWRDVFPDQRTQFQRGQILAQTVQEQCPDELEPALLLTRRTDVAQGYRTTDTHSLYVVNIDEWLRTPDNAALAYLANHLPVDASAVRAFVEDQLNVGHVAEWLGQDTERLAQLAQVVDLRSIQPTSPQQAVDAITTLGALDPEDVDKLIEFVVRLTDAGQRAELFRGATQDEPGRRLAALVLQERTDDRVADAHRDLADYKALLDGQETTETEMQRFLAEHPLLFGLDYASIQPQASGPSGWMDFVLERFDGYNDLVELKGPNEEIIRAPAHLEGTAVPSPHTYRLSPALAQALAQAMAYRDRLTRFAEAAAELHGIRGEPREPRLLIVVGRLSMLAEHQRRVLRELNRSLHRAEVIPYDLIALRAEKIIENIERYIQGDASDA